MDEEGRRAGPERGNRPPKLPPAVRELIAAGVAVFATVTIFFLIFDTPVGVTVQGLSAVSDPLTPEEQDRLLEEFGSSESTVSRYTRYLGETLSGNLGTSFQSGKPVSGVIAQRAWPTLILGACGVGLATLIAMLWGPRAAVRQRKDRRSRGTVMGSLLASPPVWWLGILVLIVFASMFRWFPVAGFETPASEYLAWPDRILDVARHLVLPALTLALVLAGEYFFIVRWSVARQIERLTTGGATTSRRAATRAALPDIARGIARTVGYVIACLLAVEYIYSYPGIGELMPGALQVGDFPLILGLALALSLGCLLVGVIVSFLPEAAPWVSDGNEGSGEEMSLRDIIRKRASAKLGVGLLAIFAMIALIGPILVGRDQTDESYAATHNQPQMVKPSWLLTEGDKVEFEAGQDSLVAEENQVDYEAIGTFAYPLGTDDRGRSLFTLLIWGVRGTVMFALKVALVAGAVGAFAGWARRRSPAWLSAAIDWCTWYVASLPALVILIPVISLRGRSTWPVTIGLGLLMWAGITRSVRNQSRRRGGAGTSRQVATRVATSALLVFGFAAFYESVISFFGLAHPTTITLGSILADAYDSGATLLGAWWYFLVPGIVLTLLIFAAKLSCHVLEDRQIAFAGADAAGNPRVNPGR